MEMSLACRTEKQMGSSLASQTETSLDLLTEKQMETSLACKTEKQSVRGPLPMPPNTMVRHYIPHQARNHPAYSAMC